MTEGHIGTFILINSSLSYASYQSVSSVLVGLNMIIIVITWNSLESGIYIILCHYYFYFQVIDRRDAFTTDEMFNAICYHIEYSFNGGHIM